MTTDRRKQFEQLYRTGNAAWDTDRPQPALVALVEAGEIRGPVLDVGCGSGANAMYLAGIGLEVVGVDFAANAIQLARQRNFFAPNPVRWVLGDIRDVQAHSSGFASVLDIGVLHTLPELERPGHVALLRELLAPGGRIVVICFSDAAPEDFGNRLSREELRSLFCHGWEIGTLKATQFIGRHPMLLTNTTSAEPAAWLLTAVKAPA